MMPEWDLIRRFRAGDRDAFSSLYRVHYPSVFRFALHMTGDRLKAGEITQDVFVWLIHHAGDFDPARGELAAFLIGVTRKLIQRRSQTESRFVPFDDMAERPDRGLWDRDERESDAAELRKAIGALPERYREAVVLCDLEEKSYEEAAALLQCALGTVRSRLHRARELLAKKLRARQRCSV
ncbi:MAG TPA: sigma-70 family RNA polymerase sigma factor [Bryobacteraceae bacterium]|nr:sigma-70 family RNA polymerase sigma factor [Bryobacteraceae bacterium]